MEIPSPGLGTFQNTDPEQCARSVRTALEVGYRHVDAAARYDNEEAVGAGLAASDVPRDEIFLATKVLHPRLTDTADPASVVASARACLDRLDVDSVDLLYVHWPDEYDLDDAFGAFSELRDDGLIDYAGVANFTVELLEEARDRFSPIVANQVEMHPLLQQEELRAYCARNDITVVAYAPLIQGKVTEVTELRSIAEKHGVSEAQVSLAWIQEKGVVPIPKATGEAHLRENWESQNLDLDAEDIARIDSIDREERVVDPDFAPDW